MFDFESVFAAFRDDDVYGSEMYNKTIGLVFGPTILGMHGKQHHDHRSLVAKAFRQSALAQWEPEVIDPICDQLVDEIKNDGEADLVKAVTFEFPTRVTAALLGLPQEDLELFRRLSLQLISITENIEAGLTASVELGTYFQDQVDQRRRTMTDDIIGDLVAAEIDGEKLTDEAIISFLRLLLPAGLETTYRSSSNLLYLLLNHPDQLEALQQDRNLIPAAMEEGLRYETPLVTVPRNTNQDVEIHGVPIPEGAQVNLCIGSANRDEKRWTDADAFDIHRPRRAHISFAGGIHSCLGMHLARVETKAMLNSLFDRVTDMQLVPDDDTKIVGMPFRSPKHLPVTFPPRLMRSRAAILHDVGGPWSVEEFELDPPRAGEVLVEMAAAGMCHSDEHILNGDMSAPNEVMKAFGLPAMFPMIGGHEGSAVVVEVGEGVTEFAPGDHVVTSFVAVCGQCRWCSSGMEYICDMGAQVMIPGMPTDGTFRHHTADGRDLGHLSKVGAFAETHCRFDGLDRQDRSAPAAGADARCCPARCRPATARRRTAPRYAPATPSSSSAREASAPRRSRARGSTVPRRSSRWIRSSSSRSRHCGSAPPTAASNTAEAAAWCAI